MHPGQLREHVIEPVLKHLEAYSESAVNLLLMTAAVESDLGEYIAQINGPALGIYQMEPDTEYDILHNFVSFRGVLHSQIESCMTLRYFPEDGDFGLAGNLYYATAMARVHYLRVPEALPEPDDIRGLANYWKDHYNTHLGMGTVDSAIHKYKTLVLGEKTQWKL